MYDERPPCAAITKDGDRCKNRARIGSAYCYVHRAADGSQPAVDAPRSSAEPSQSDFTVLVAELNSLAGELQRRFPDYRAPEFSSQGMMELLKKNLDRVTPDLPLETLRQLRSNLEGTSSKDLIDPETWKGLWYVLNAAGAAQTAALREGLASRLSGLPGMTLLVDLKGNLEGTSPKEFLDPETWKGMWLIMNYSVQATARDLKRRVTGE